MALRSVLDLVVFLVLPAIAVVGLGVLAAKRISRWSCRSLGLGLAIVVLGLAGAGYGFTYIWPLYAWDLRLASPDGRYDLVVLRGDAAAFADFSHEIYLFPHALTPEDRAKDTHVWLTPIWRGDKYLVYSGDDHPMFRWTGATSIEIDLKEAEYSGFKLESVKRFERRGEPILTSVVFGKEDDGNTLP